MLPFGVQAFPERRVSGYSCRECAAETARYEEVGGGLDGILGCLVQGRGLLAAAECERGIVNCTNA